jgi:hypothetical protein
VLFSVFNSGLDTFAQEGKSAPAAAATLPRGNWTAYSSPYMGAGYENLPVLVTGVTSEIDGGIAITNVAIENRTTQLLTSVKLSWYLSAEGKPEVILQQGKTGLLKLRHAGGIKAGETREVEYPVISFANIYKPLLKEGVLNGKYVIHVAVSEAHFADGSTQMLMAANNARRTRSSNPSSR